MRDQSPDWTRLDNAAKIFPPTSNKQDTKVFRFACQLNEWVDQDILQQVGRMALATAGCSAIMLAIYAVVGRFTTAVLLGGLLGTVIAVGNFLALSITVSNALDRAAAGDNSVKACMSIQSSSVVRTAILAVIYVLLFHAKVCDPLAALLPLLFAQAAIKLIEFFRKDSKGGDAVP